MTLEPTTSWLVPHSLVAETEGAVREAGLSGHERFVLWTGRLDGATFQVRHLHVPDQVAYRTDLGLGVRVDGPALHALNVWLFEHDEILGVQVHSHPDEAYHSPTDDAFPIVTTLGSLSIVLGSFGHDGFFSPGTACYRLTSRGFTACTRRTAELVTAV